MKEFSKICKDSLNLFAPAKVNLHLEILGIRNDGFHEIAMVMQSINLYDLISICSTDDSRITLLTDDPSLTTGNDNLIIKAANLLKKYSSIQSLGANINLKKNIPIGAGLAGGSSDAAATLVGLNALWKLGFSNQELEVMASELGSDIPFCISGGTQLCFGRGEVLEPLTFCQTDLSLILLKNPSVSVSTAWAYNLNKQIHQRNYQTTEVEFENKRNRLKNSKWLKRLGSSYPPPLQNDLQKVVAPATPAVQSALEILESISGSLSVAMSGSGPSCFGLFPDLKTAKLALDQNRSKIKLAGLEAWCCSFISDGVKICL